jgi:hypothetical protein
MKMIATPSQISVDPSQIQCTLENIGYSLVDFGNHWRTNALYRGGDNKMSIRIYKNTGVWTDFVNGSKSLPFERLLQLTIGKDYKKLNEITSSLKKSDEFAYIKKETIEMEEIYPKEILQKLFPNYNFYTKKGFSEETLKFYKTGLAGAGKMYRRMVFPIFNEHQQIVGFSGRKIDEHNEQSPKWKHLGKRKNWVYPAYVPNGTSVDSIIKQKQEVVLVESIGDSMALFESGIKNNLVTFGIGCSPAIIAYLNSTPIKKITIATNNDFRSAANHGYNGAVKILMALRPYFDFDSIEIRMPPEGFNDLSDAYQNGHNLESWYNKGIDKKEYLANLHAYVTKYMNFFKQKEAASLIKLIENYE